MTTAFFLNAVVYGVSFLIYRFVRDPEGEREALAMQHAGFRRYGQLIRHAHVWLLAPTWIAINASIGLWFSQSLYQFTKPDSPFRDTQWLLQGFDFKRLLDRAERALHASMHYVPAEDNPSARLGAILGTMANAGRANFSFRREATRPTTPGCQPSEAVTITAPLSSSPSEANASASVSPK